MRAVISNPHSEKGNPPEGWESEGQIPNHSMLYAFYTTDHGQLTTDKKPFHLERTDLANSELAVLYVIYTNFSFQALIFSCGQRTQKAGFPFITN